MKSNENSIGSCIYVHKDICEDFPRRKANYDREKALEESRRLLDKIATPPSSARRISKDVQIITCSFCQLLLPLNKTNNCRHCEETFCYRHKTELDHNCEKLSKETAKYLNAKNQFKLRLREAKSNAAR